MVIILDFFFGPVRTDIKISQYPGFQHRHLLNTPLEGEGGGNELDAGTEEKGWGPADNNTVTNVTVQLGVTAYLHCKTHAVGDKVEVSFYLSQREHIKSFLHLTFCS